MTRPADLDYIEELEARIEALEAALRTSSDLEKRYADLCAAYQDLEARYEALKAATGVSIDQLEPRRAELVKWGAMEAGRWLDPKAGEGVASKFGLNLLAITALLARVP
jgi:hypothetical protein